MKAFNSAKKLVFVWMGAVAIIGLNPLNVQAQAPKPSEDACTECEVKLATLEKQILRLRYIAQGKVMALKSTELKKDNDLRAMVALQAFNFNQKNNPNLTDIDIYNGLYGALKQFKDPLTENLSSHTPGMARSLAVNKLSGEMFSGGGDGKILRWSHKDGAWFADFISGEHKDFYVYAISLSPDGNRLVAGVTSKIDTKLGYLEVYDLKNVGQSPKKIGGFTAPQTVLYSKDGKGAYVMEQDGVNILYTDFNTVKTIIQSKEKINALAMSPDGLWLAGAGESGAVYTWDISENLKLRMVFKGDDELTSVAFSPRTGEIIFGDQNGVVKIISLSDSHQPQRILGGHEAQIEQILFNNAGTQLITTSRDGSLRIWQWYHLTMPPIVQSMEDTWTWSAVVSPDDQQLLIGAHSKMQRPGSHAILTWPLSMDAMASALCSHLSRSMTKDEWDNFCGQDFVYEKICNK